MDPDIMRIISDYNYNQEKYNRNMSSLIQLLTTRVEIVSFTPSDLSSLFDLSVNNAFEVVGESPRENNEEAENNEEVRNRESK